MSLERGREKLPPAAHFESLVNDQKKDMTLKTPLAKSTRKKISRQIAYESARKIASNTWGPLIRKNRDSSTLKLPLNHVSELRPHKPPPLSLLIHQISENFQSKDVYGAATNGNSILNAYKEASDFIDVSKEKGSFNIKRKDNLIAETNTEKLKNDVLSCKNLKLNAELNRARERFTLKTTKVSSWAKQLTHRNVKKGLHNTILSQVRQKETLRKQLLYKEPVDECFESDQNEADDLIQDGIKKNFECGEWSEKEMQNRSNQKHFESIYHKGDDAQPEIYHESLLYCDEKRNSNCEDADFCIDDEEEELDQNSFTIKPRKNFLNTLHKNPQKFSEQALPAIKQAESDLQNEKTINLDYSREEVLKMAFAEDKIFFGNKVNADDQELILEEKHEEASVALPGWGVWSGSCQSQTRNLKSDIFKKQRHPKVVVNQNINNRSSFNFKRAPYPFDNVNEFVASLKKPINPELNSACEYKKLTSPRITAPVGVLVDPIQRDTSCFEKQPKLARKSTF